jgi:hypothetical protein
MTPGADEAFVGAIECHNQCSHLAGIEHSVILQIDKGSFLGQVHGITSDLLERRRESENPHREMGNHMYAGFMAVEALEVTGTPTISKFSCKIRRLHPVLVQTFVYFTSLVMLPSPQPPFNPVGEHGPVQSTTQTATTDTTDLLHSCSHGHADKTRHARQPADLIRETT